jgi:hypothetical protein
VTRYGKSPNHVPNRVHRATSFELDEFLTTMVWITSLKEYKMDEMIDAAAP